MSMFLKAASAIIRVADPEEAGAFQDLTTGTSFGGICAKLADVQGAEVAASMAGTFLAGWIATGLVDHIET